MNNNPMENNPMNNNPMNNNPMNNNPMNNNNDPIHPTTTSVLPEPGPNQPKKNGKSLQGIPVW